jgi:hypothetical protein
VTDEAQARRPPPRDVRWQIHDIAVGSLAGLTVGFVVGLFGLRWVDSLAVPWIVAVAGAVLGAYWLLASARRGTGIGLRRVIAWAMLALATTFLAMLMVAIATFE